MLKKYILILLPILILSSCSDKSGTTLKPTPKVDERTELLSIVFQLAGAEEYATTRVPEYAADINTYFEPYKDHELIQWIPELREKYGIAFDAVASYSIRLKIENGEISFQDNIDIGDIDFRWEKDIASEFLVKLNKFYTDSNFADFFRQHKALYSIAEKNFNETLDLIDFTWFERYYGTKPEGNFHLVVSLTNGMGNYGPNIEYSTGQRDIYAIIGTWNTDSTGNPIYAPEDYINLIVHEFNHSFCNPLIFEFYPEIENAAIQTYNQDSLTFQRQAYGYPVTVMCEILVRASEVQYMKDTNESQEDINEKIASEQRRGFVWIDKLCNKLDEYEQQRNSYPTLHSYMPEIVTMINELY